ncbi:hypothetical protein [Streptomyces sp. NBC_01602]|uniref:hypothetical protein n=1 Tax=Streptomyces sp. NBC_01602 TaxID=2975893 RepID=UPI003868643D
MSERPEFHGESGVRASDVLPAWAAITNWLAVHAPASHATLRPGATGADVQSVEDGLGAPLPADLVTLLQTCNGTVDASDVERDPDEYDPVLFLAQHHLLPLGAIVAVRGSGESADQFWSDWVPFAVADYAVTPWDGLAVEPGGRLATFSQASGEPPSQPHTEPGHASLAEFLNARAEALTQGTGPLTATATPGFHEGALVWGPLPGDATPWAPAHSENEPPAQTAEHAWVDHGATPAGRGS